ncbi:MAG: M28 family peptidase [Patescibacteria group bacterium]
MKTSFDLAGLAGELASIPGSPGREELISAYVREFFAARGVRVEQDDAGRAIGAAAGNLRVQLPGDPSLPRLLFAAHLDIDAAPPQPAPRKGRAASRPDGNAADDRVGVALLLALGARRAGARIGCPVDLLLTVGEEACLAGSRQLAGKSLAADYGFVLDHPGPPGTMVVQGDAGVEFRAVLRAFPERSASPPEARWVMGRVMARMPVGRLADGYYLSLKPLMQTASRAELGGKLYGPDARDFAAVLARLAKILAGEAAKHGYYGILRRGRMYPGYCLAPSAPVVELAVAAAGMAGIEPLPVHERRASDANILNMLGLPTLNLGGGWRETHDGRAFIVPGELERISHYLDALVETASSRRPGGTRKGGAG